MMKPVWHVKKIRCLCEKEIAYISVSFNANGGVLIEGVCVQCGKEVTYQGNIFDITAVCLALDGKIVCEGNSLIN
jgi:hypothetical protein